VALSTEGIAAAAHDCSDGGLAVTLAECAIAGDTGFAVGLPGDLPDHVTLFSESASRAVVAVAESRTEDLEAAVRRHGVPFSRLGETGGPRMVFGGAFELPVAEAAAVYESVIPALMSQRREAG
jgi:phosphoribosylformylglycinamidine synthase